jgi:H+/Cl- antiporter ClcA
VSATEDAAPRRAEAAPSVPPAVLARLLLAGALLGVPAAAAGVLFESLLHGGTTLVWTNLPDSFGWSEPKWWYVLLVPAVAGVLVALVMRLPGHGGHTALDGMSLDPAPPIALPSVVAAGFISLVGGVVLGPEAPILALGLGIGLVAARAARLSGPHTRILVLAGAFAAMAGLFGGPIAVSLFMFESLAASGALPAASIGPVLLPGLVGAGVGSVVFTGVNHWAGVHEQSLGLPGLPPYPTVHVVDLAWCVVLAVAVALVVIGARAGARAVAGRVRLITWQRLVLFGLAIGALAAIFRAVTDHPVDLVLFSGQAADGTYIAEGSAGVLVAIVLFKSAGYLLSLASGFRGGPIFPAVSIGVGLGALAANLLPGLALTPAVVAGVAAGAAGVLGLPFFGALLASLLAGSSAADTAPMAVVAAVVAALVAARFRSAQPADREAGTTSDSPGAST